MVVYVVECECCMEVWIDSIWRTRAGANTYLLFLPRQPLTFYEIREFEVKEYEEVDDS